jgi:uncharacterized protein (TIGR02271 family)
MMQSDETLKSIRDLDDYKVAHDDPDVRGWTVVDANGHRMGTVSDLIVNTDKMKVEYLAVDGAGKGGVHRVPAASASLDESRREVMIGGGVFDTGSASRSEAAIGGQQKRAERDSLTRSEEELKIGKREVAAGEVVVGKHVETERVSQPVTVERERVTVERRPVTGEARARAADIGSDEIRVPVTEEEVIVEKRPVVKEELVINKERVRDTQHIDTEVRREEFDVHGTPDTLVDERDSTKRGRS